MGLLSWWRSRRVLQAEPEVEVSESRDFEIPESEHSGLPGCWQPRGPFTHSSEPPESAPKPETITPLTHYGLPVQEEDQSAASVRRLGLLAWMRYPGRGPRTAAHVSRSCLPYMDLPKSQAYNLALKDLRSLEKVGSVKRRVGSKPILWAAT